MTYERRHGRPTKYASRPIRRRLPRFDSPFNGDVVIWRETPVSDPRGAVRSNIVRTCIQHSPHGYDCGRSGVGSAELALNILAAFLPPRPEPVRRWGENERDDDPLKTRAGVTSRFALEHHQEFKRDFIACMDPNGGRIEATAVLTWIAARKRARVTAAG